MIDIRFLRENSNQKKTTGSITAQIFTIIGVRTTVISIIGSLMRSNRYYNFS